MSAAKPVDVVIPAYNAASTAEAAMGSMQRQTVAGIGMIIVDNGSTDRTGALVDDIAAQDARIRVVHRPNGGIADALNEGLAHVDAPFSVTATYADFLWPNETHRSFPGA